LSSQGGTSKVVNGKNGKSDTHPTFLQDGKWTLSLQANLRKGVMGLVVCGERKKYEVGETLAELCTSQARNFHYLEFGSFQ